MLALGCWLLFAFPCCVAQTNLVPNHSFELNDTCPYTIGFQEGDRPLHWRSWANSPEYFHACAGELGGVDTLVGVPMNGWTFQQAWDGEAYVGFYTFGIPDDYREYIGVGLVEPLVVGEVYDVSFRVNLAWDGSYWYTGGACNNLGLLFTMNSNAWDGLTGPPFAFRNYAHLYSPAVIADTVEWVLVSGSFTADSAYRYVVLGNFFTNALTEVEAIPPGGGETVYHLVDDVRVCLQGTGCLGTGIGAYAEAARPSVALIPMHEEILLTWQGHTGYRLRIMNLAGHVLAADRSYGEALRLDAQNWAPGMYVALFQHGEHTEIVKFVVTR